MRVLATGQQGGGHLGHVEMRLYKWGSRTIWILILKRNKLAFMGTYCNASTVLNIYKHEVI